MAQRYFNKALINGIAVAIKDLVDGSGEIKITGSDVKKVTDDHILHNLRLNVHYEANFKTFRDRRDLETDPDVDVFGGDQLFYFDDTLVATFPGVVSPEYNESDNITKIIIKGESEDA